MGVNINVFCGQLYGVSEWHVVNCRSNGCKQGTTKQTVKHSVQNRRTTSNLLQTHHWTNAKLSESVKVFLSAVVLEHYHIESP